MLIDKYKCSAKASYAFQVAKVDQKLSLYLLCYYNLPFFSFKLKILKK